MVFSHRSLIINIRFLLLYPAQSDIIINLNSFSLWQLNKKFMRTNRILNHLNPCLLILVEFFYQSAKEVLSHFSH